MTMSNQEWLHDIKKERYPRIMKKMLLLMIPILQSLRKMMKKLKLKKAQLKKRKKSYLRKILLRMLIRMTGIMSL